MSLVRIALVCVSLLLAAPLGLASPRQDPVAPPPTAKQKDPQAVAEAFETQIAKGDFAGAERDARAMIAADPKAYGAWFYLGLALHSAGKIDDALPAHLEATHSNQPGLVAVAHYNAGCAYALKGDKDKALEQLELAIDKRVSQQAGFAADPDLKSLIGDPRFDALLAKRRGGAAKPKRVEAEAKFETIVYSGNRKGSRIIWLPDPIAPATQMHLDWAPVTWNDDLGTKVEAGEYDGQRWRLGKDFWTSFDTNSDVMFGGVAIPAGAWYLTLVRHDGKVTLQFNDSAIVRRSKLDGFVSEKLPPPAYEAELTVERGNDIVKELTLELKAGAKAMQATFTVAFGPYRLSAPIVAGTMN